MRVLLVRPGASWSTFDVCCGIRDAMTRAGVEVVEYALDGRLERAQRWMAYLWRHRVDKELPHYTMLDVRYAASKDIVERALWHQVDWILCVAVGWLHPQALVLARRAKIKIGVVFTESPYEDDEQLEWAKFADVCWTNERTSVDRFHQVCKRAHYWQHAIDPEKHHVGQVGEAAAHDVVFVGTGWPERCDMLQAVDWDGIDLGLYGTWELLGSRSKLRRYMRGGIVSNEVTAALYRNAKVGLNPHRTSAKYERGSPAIVGAESMNPRCYELAANGCFFLSDERAEVRETFGDVVPTFRTAAELEQQVRYWLAHPDERRERAARLPGLVAGHTFDNRVKAMLRELEG